jgi:hypothetical protein
MTSATRFIDNHASEIKRHIMLKLSKRFSYSISMICAVVCVLFSPGANANENSAYIDDDDKTHEALDVGRGKVLVTGLEKACPHLQANLKSSEPGVITLLMTNRDLTQFAAGVCEGKCGLLQMNNLLERCSTEDKLQGCVFYAGLHKKTVYVMAIDAFGKTLQESCK